MSESNEVPIGFFIVNDLQTLPPSKRTDGKIFLSYVSDDFKMKNKICEEK